MTKTEEDIFQIAKTAELLGFAEKKFLITGATGMIGRVLTSALLRITDATNIFAVSNNLERIKLHYKDSGIRCYSFETISDICDDVDYVIHLASPTSSEYLKEKPIETIFFMLDSTKAVLDFSKRHHSRLLYISSMEVYGEVLDDNPKKEEHLGYISLNNTRSSYPEAKRMCELLCYSYFKEYGVKAYSARLAQTFGAGTAQDDPRLFGYFGRCIVNSSDIVLKTKGESYGNYCYISDAINSFFYILSNGKEGLTYNVVGDNSRFTILELAKLVSNNIGKGKIKVRHEISDTSIFPNPTKLNMDNSRIKALGWKPRFTVIDMFNRMIESWKE